nr:MAG TPA: LysM domain [Caudoviricetes sp.]
MRIKNKFKFIRSTIILILILLGIFCISVSKEKTEYIDYTVGRGETLWSIASDHTDGDIRDYIYTIKDINGMITSELQDGQTIKLLKEVK